MSGVRACPSKRRRSEWLGTVSILTEARKTPISVPWLFHAPPQTAAAVRGGPCTQGTAQWPHVCSFLLTSKRSVVSSPPLLLLHLYIRECSGSAALPVSPICFSKSTLFTLSTLCPRRAAFTNLQLNLARTGSRRILDREEERDLNMSLLPTAPATAELQWASCHQPFS